MNSPGDLAGDPLALDHRPKLVTEAQLIVGGADHASLSRRDRSLAAIRDFPQAAAKHIGRLERLARADAEQTDAIGNPLRADRQPSSGEKPRQTAQHEE